jgi:tetratricopeptide (TPR) repeat protein
LALLIVGLLALAIRATHLYQIQDNPFFANPIVDAWSYHSDAVAIAESGDWTPPYAFFQAPLTTYFLAVIYKAAGYDLVWPRLVQAVIGTLTAMGMFLLGRSLFGTRAGWIAGLVTAFYPLLIFYEGELLAPTITVFLDVATLILLLVVLRSRPGWLWVTPGLLFGLRALATTNNIAILPVFWLWTYYFGRSQGWARGQMVLSIAALTLGVGVAIAPVTIHNWTAQQEFVLVSSNAGLNFYIGNSGDYDSKVAIRPGADWDEFINKHVRMGRKVGPEMSGYYFGQAWDYIRTNPFEYGRLLLHKTGLLLRGDEVLRNQEIYPFRRYSVVLRVLLWKVPLFGSLGLALPFGVLIPLAWPGFILVFRNRHKQGYLLVAYAIAYSLSVVAFFITARYRLPIVIPLILLTAYGWSHIRNWWVPKRWRLAAVCGMVVLCFVSKWGVDSMPSEMNPDAYYSLATTMALQGDLDGAERYYEKAVQLNPEDASAWMNLGLYVYEAKGMLDQAEAHYRKAISVRLDYAPAYFNLARLAEARKQPEQAERLYLEAARIDPIMAAPYINLAVMALSRGDYTEARRFYKEANLRDPENAAALIGLGVTTFETEGFAPAMRFFDAARRLEPENPDLHYNLALVFARSGQPARSVEHARRLIEIRPEENNAYIIFADQMAATGRAADARRFLEQAAREHPDLPGPQAALSRLAP